MTEGMPTVRMEPTTFFVQLQIPESEPDLGIALEVKDPHQRCADPLSGHRGNSCAGNAHSRNPKGRHTENEHRIQQNIGNGAGSLADHGVHRPAGGLEQPLTQDLDKYAHRQQAADLRVDDAAFHRFRHLGLDPVVGLHPHRTEDHEAHRNDQHQRQSVSSGKIGLFLVLLSQGFAQQGIDAHADAHGETDLQILHRESQGQSGNGTFGDLGNIDAVHHVVKCLDDHGYDHGQRHVDKQFANRHHAHLIFL